MSIKKKNGDVSSCYCKMCIELPQSGLLIFHCVPDFIILTKKTGISCTVMSANDESTSSLLSVPKYWLQSLLFSVTSS
jgi:hypothetical protein